MSTGTENRREAASTGIAEETSAAPGATLRLLGRRLRLEYAILAILGSLLGAYALAFFVLGVDFDRIREWGYVGIFFIALSGSATIVLPRILIGLVAGFGDAIGELSGYGLGYAGTDLIRKQRHYGTFARWMSRRGMATIFLLSTFPNPFFDLVGAAAGASRMPAGFLHRHP